MICITGDVHHMSLQTGDQHCSDVTESDSAGLFVELCREYDVKATLYCTGKLFAQEWESVKKWAFEPVVEIGGHTFHAFDPALPHRIWKKLTGNYNGPEFMERSDIRKNLDIIQSLTGKTPVSWRNHCYFHGCNTDRLLVEAGFESCSDIVSAPGSTPYVTEDNIVTVPINVIPDHEHIYHGDRTPEHVAWWVKRYGFTDAFGSDSYSIQTWLEIVTSNIEENEKLGVNSVVLTHPLCMYVADKMHAFTQILEYARKYGSCTMAELVDSYKRTNAKNSLEDIDEPVSKRRAA